MITNRPFPSYLSIAGLCFAGLCRVGILLTLVLCASNALAQGADEEEKPIEPEPIKLVTGDGMQLTATWYASKQGKEAVPVVLLHGLDGSRTDYHALATYLHAKGDGYAVLVPDLRGHGDSKIRRGFAAPLKATTMSAVEFARMVTFDMLRLKSFLLQKNNAGELNIEKLVVVGADMGASVATIFARMDWSIPPQGNKKQGQDIKVLVLISPQWTTKGLSMRAVFSGNPLRTYAVDRQLQNAMKHHESINFRAPVSLDFRREVAVMIAAGKEKSRAVADAKRLQTMLKPFHPDEDKDLAYGTLKTSLQGTKMLGVSSLNLNKYIAQFIKSRLEGRTLNWAERKNPYAE